MKDLFKISLFLILATAACQRITDPPEPGDDSLFAGCIVPGSASKLEIVTFNMETFPKSGSLTTDMAARLIRTINADVVVLQEITSEGAFLNLLKKLPGWSGQYYLINNSDWNLAYLFKGSEITYNSSSVKLLFPDDFYAFPRPPLEVKITHKPTGQTVYLIDLHLKCCSGSDNEDRRREAAEKLHSYVIQNRNSDAVVILGDYNDEISANPPASDPFYIFVSDPSNFRFADMPIATGSQLWWSYPSWPSHIDHILVTNELFSRIDTTVVYKPEPCYPQYIDIISDHRPVGITLK